MMERRRGQCVVAFTAIVAGALYVLVPHRAWTELLFYDGSVLVSVVAASFAASRMPAGPGRTAWSLAAVSLAGFLVAELIRWWFHLGGLDAFLTVADVVLLAAHAPLAAAALLLSRATRHRHDTGGWLDVTLLTLVAGLLLWTLVVQPALTEQDVAWTRTSVILGHPLVVFAVASRLALSRSARSRAVVLFAVGLAVTLAADVWFAWSDLRGLYRPGSTVDAVVLFGYALVAAAALDPSAARPGTEGRERAPGRERLVIVLVAGLTPQAVLVVALARRSELGLDTATLALATATVIGLLVGLRSWSLLVRARDLEAERGSHRLATVVEHSADAIVFVDVDGRVRYASPTAERWWGESGRHESLLDRISPEDRATVAGQLLELAGAGHAATCELSAGLIEGSGRRRVVEGCATNLLDDASVAALVVTLRDVTVRRELEAQLERRAFHDDLTGLANRALFVNRVTHALERAEESGQGVAVVFVDLDDFKAVNDGMGHAAGDALLQQLADRIRGCVPPGDTVARLGGDEFAVLLEDVPSESFALGLAARLLDMVSMPVDLGEHMIAVAASMGLATAQPDSTVASLLRDADLAMYSAKTGGKSRVVVFDERLRQATERQLRVKLGLPAAVTAGEVRVAYQPVRSVPADETVGFEALLRWEHPQLGRLDPREIVAAAEESGFVIDLGRWVLDRAVSQIADWNRRTGVDRTVSVNVSAAQLRHPTFADDVRRSLDTHGLEPGLLSLEVSESSLADADSAFESLEALAAIGCGIAIDDFGTGYSALTVLRRFPVAAVKIDRRFIARLDERVEEQDFVRSVLAMADALSIGAVAQGVETAEELSVLDRMDCGFAQGFYLQTPMTPLEVEAQLLSITDDGAPQGRVERRTAGTAVSGAGASGGSRPGASASAD